MVVRIAMGEITSREGMVSYHNITDSVRKAIEQSGVTNGTCTVVTPHTTCAVFFEEYTHDTDRNGIEFLQLDMNRILDTIVPPHNSAEAYLYPGEEHYCAVESWPDASMWLPGGDRSSLWNGDAHIKATLVGCSEVFAVVDCQLAVGKTGYVYFVDFDCTRARKRQYKIVVMGE